MKKIKFLIIFLYLISLSNFLVANSEISLKDYIQKEDIEKDSTQIYLLSRCSALYTYASAATLKTDAVSSKNFIETANNLLFKSVELRVIDYKEKLETAQKKASDERKQLFEIYILEGKRNWKLNKSYFKGSYIAEDMSICTKLVEDK
jgi:hypothetical protein